MCGICGVVQIEGEPRHQVVDRETLDRMTDAMVHRGPDDRGVYMSEGVALGVRRLSIVDVQGGHQPFANEDDTVWAVNNGELYNHVELRRRLADEDGHRFRSRCDTEILPHLYERYGPSLVEHLRGMFGLAVWDARRKRAVLARDRLGIKPLYYAQCGELLLFASELKSLLSSGLVSEELDYEAIDVYLTLGFVPAPRTPLRQVSKLLPGNRLVVHEGSVRTERYWSYPEPAPDRTRSLNEHAEALLAELEESVRLRLMSDVPLGAMLSGGLDSSLIVALMARNMSEPVKTFSVGFREDERGNELADARRVAALFGAEHHELELSYRDTNVDVRDLIWHLDEPIAEVSALGFLALSELAARHVKVALSGQGADELFGGYLKHRAAWLCGFWDRLPNRLRRSASSVGPYARGPLQRASRTLFADGPADRLLAMSGKLDGERRARLLRRPMPGAEAQVARRAVLERLSGQEATADPLAVTLFLDGQLNLADDLLHYFDRTSMAHSLEVRVPFLDHKIVELAATIPSVMKIKMLRTKVVLKHAARGILPEAVVDKPKLGFLRSATGGWLRSQLEGAGGDYLRATDARYAEFLDRDEVESMLSSHVNGDGRRSEHLLLSILLLEVWLADFLPRARGVRALPPRERIEVAS